MRWIGILLCCLLLVGCSEVGLQDIQKSTQTENISALEKNSNDVPQEPSLQEETEKLAEPKCPTPFQFTHHLVNVEDAAGIFFGPGAHVAPHDHMAYFGTRSTGSEQVVIGQKNSEQIQIYAPVDFYRYDLRREERIGESGNTYIEWGAYFYTCDEKQLMFGHVSDPNDIFFDTELNCDNGSPRTCTLEGNKFIPAGTPILQSSGYAAGFDFGLCFPTLSAEEVQQYPSNGFSLNPWRSFSGKCVCPYDFYPEEIRKEYLALLGDSSCGPFNQDVPGTAKGLWFPTPSQKPESNDPWFHEDFDEQYVVWLYTDFKDDSIQMMTVGQETNFGLDYYQYGFTISSEETVNQAWETVVPGRTYCFELHEQISANEYDPEIAKVLLAQVSDTTLTLEAFNQDHCSSSLSFTGNQKSFYR